jgi:hypothetical protein
MPITMTRFETGKVSTGEATALSRKLEKGDVVGYKPGDEIILTSREVKPGDIEDTIIATAKISNVTTSTVGTRKTESRLALLEGFDDGMSWYRNFVQMYGECSDDTPVYRLQFRIEQTLLK